MRITYPRSFSIILKPCFPLKRKKWERNRHSKITWAGSSQPASEKKAVEASGDGFPGPSRWPEQNGRNGEEKRSSQEFRTWNEILLSPVEAVSYFSLWSVARFPHYEGKHVDPTRIKCFKSCCISWLREAIPPQPAASKRCGNEATFWDASIFRDGFVSIPSLHQSCQQRCNQLDTQSSWYFLAQKVPCIERVHHSAYQVVFFNL